MKVLTLTQPWATLVAIGAKRIETRSWGTAYRGQIAIHAAKGFPADARDFVYAKIVREFLAPHFRFEDSIPVDKQLPLGCVLATARLVNCVQTELCDRCDGCGWYEGGAVLQTHCQDCGGCGGRPRGVKLTDREAAFGNYEERRFAWILEDVVALPEPVPAKGALGLWEWNP